MIKVHKLENTPIPSNCFVVHEESVNDCIIIDPGSEDESLLFDFLDSNLLTPKFIILTHEHFDHCWGVNGLRKKYNNIKLVCSSECSYTIQDKKKNYSVFYEQPGFEIKAADIVIEEDCSLELNDLIVSFTLAKGHSASGMIFSIKNYIFTGDELIKGLRTVTKLKTGSKEKPQESIGFLRKLKGRGMIVCPGHGETFEMDKYDL